MDPDRAPSPNEPPLVTRWQEFQFDLDQLSRALIITLGGIVVVAFALTILLFVWSISVMSRLD